MKYLKQTSQSLFDLSKIIGNHPWQITESLLKAKVSCYQARMYLTTNQRHPYDFCNMLCILLNFFTFIPFVNLILKQGSPQTSDGIR